MKAKDKKRKYIFFTLKNIIIFSVTIISIFYIIIFYHYYFGESVVYATEASSSIEELKISEAERLDIDTYMQNNVKEGVKEEYTVEEVELEFITKYRNNASLPKGTLQVTQEGREGKQQITIKKTYENDELINEEQVSAVITKAAINKIVEVGTGSGSLNYEVKVGDTVYVTSDRLSVMVEPNDESQKIATLSKDDELKVLEIQSDWYKIRAGSTIGYVKSEATTYKDYKQQDIQNNPSTSGSSTTSQKGKSELIANLSIDMALNKPSGLTLEQFKKILSDNKDKNNIFEQNAEYFYYIEKQYNINGVFVAAVGIHESSWGTSKIAQEKYNLFGYGAYDSNPYNGAYTFSSYSECIDLIARVFVKYYLNPKGTSIYSGETATGSYYNGPTLTGINKKYATDKNWANSVYTTMKYLYNKL